MEPYEIYDASTASLERELLQQRERSSRGEAGAAMMLELIQEELEERNASEAIWADCGGGQMATNLSESEARIISSPSPSKTSSPFQFASPIREQEARAAQTQASSIDSPSIERKAASPLPPPSYGRSPNVKVTPRANLAIAQSGKEGNEVNESSPQRELDAESESGESEEEDSSQNKAVGREESSRSFCDADIPNKSVKGLSAYEAAMAAFRAEKRANRRASIAAAETSGRTARVKAHADAKKRVIVRKQYQEAIQHKMKSPSKASHLQSSTKGKNVSKAISRPWRETPPTKPAKHNVFRKAKVKSARDMPSDSNECPTPPTTNESNSLTSADESVPKMKQLLNDDDDSHTHQSSEIVVLSATETTGQQEDELVAESEHHLKASEGALKEADMEIEADSEKTDCVPISVERNVIDNHVIEVGDESSSCSVSEEVSSNDCPVRNQRKTAKSEGSDNSADDECEHKEEEVDVQAPQVDAQADVVAGTNKLNDDMCEKLSPNQRGASGADDGDEDYVHDTNNIVAIEQKDQPLPPPPQIPRELTVQEKLFQETGYLLSDDDCSGTESENEQEEEEEEEKELSLDISRGKNYETAPEEEPDVCPIDPMAGAPRSLILNRTGDDKPEEGLASFLRQRQDNEMSAWSDSRPNSPLFSEYEEDIESMREKMKVRIERKDREKKKKITKISASASVVSYAGIYDSFEEIFTMRWNQKGSDRHQEKRNGAEVKELMRSILTNVGDAFQVPHTDEDIPMASCLSYRITSDKAHSEVHHTVKAGFDQLGGWTELPAGSTHWWNILWTWTSKNNVNFNELLSWQRVNHYPHARNLTRKDMLKGHLHRYNRIHGSGRRGGGLFDIMPQTFSLPKEYSQLCDVFAENEESKSSHNVWIMKPIGKSRGRGIFLVNDIADVSYGEPMIIQKYITNPLLINGFKFDLRLYVLVTSFNPLEAWISTLGFGRFSTSAYSDSIESLSDLSIHLTNSSVQKDFVGDKTSNVFESLGGLIDESGIGGTKASLKHIFTELASQGMDVEHLWKKISQVVLRSLFVVQDSIPYQSNCFELFGYDVLIDDNIRPWLIEVNSSPQLDCPTALDQEIKHKVCRDVISVLEPTPFDRAALVETLRRRLSSKPQTYSDGITAAEERANLNADVDKILKGNRPRQYGEMPKDAGNFERLAPSAALDSLLRIKRK